MTDTIRVAELEDRFSEPPIDAFVTCASYEDRCLVVPRAVSAKVHHAWLAHTVNYEAHVGINRSRLQERFHERYSDVPLRVDDPVATAIALATAVERVFEAQPTRVVVDITTFTHEAVLILLGLIQSRRTTACDVDLVYNGASRYATNCAEGEEWLSRGIASVRSVFGFPGSLLPTRPTHLVVMAGFETERAVGLVEEYEVKLVSIGRGRHDEDAGASHRDTLCRHSSRLVDAVQRLVGAFVQFEYSLYDPESTADDLAVHLAKYPGHNTVIAPLNTKLSTVGAALCAANNPAVQLCYAQARTYNFDGYSVPADNVYVYRLPPASSTAAP